jgi:hypothetical protein
MRCTVQLHLKGAPSARARAESGKMLCLVQAA